MTKRTTTKHGGTMYKQILIDVKLKTGKTADSEQSIKEADWTAVPSITIMMTMIKKKKKTNIFGQ